VYIDRPAFTQQIEDAFQVNPVVAILGPRQCGKTTLTKHYIEGLDDFNKLNYFDLEDIDDLARLEQAKLTLSHLDGLIVIDEIQRIPEIFPTIRVLADNSDLNHRYLILGSASRELIKQSSETLAGRITYIELTPFSYPEVDHINKLWLRGGFPDAYLAVSDAASFNWIKAFIKTCLERDIPNLGLNILPENLRRFWTMLAHYHANIFNSAEIGRSLQLDNKTVRHYLDILSGTFVVRTLKPWYENITKRQVKSPKIYFRDAGILNTLLGIRSKEDLLSHPKLGAIWEGLAIEEIIRFNKVDSEDCYFWAIHSEAELDLLIMKDGQRLGFEIKYDSAPKLTRSMKKAMQYLNLHRLTVIYPGNKTYPLADNVIAIGIEEYLK